MAKVGMAFAKALQEKSMMEKRRKMWEGGEVLDNYDEHEFVKHHNSSGEPHTQEEFEEEKPMEFYSKGGVAGSEDNQEEIDEHEDSWDPFEKPMSKEEAPNFAQGGMVARSNDKPSGADDEEMIVDKNEEEEEKFGGKNPKFALAMHLKKKMRGY